MLGCPRFQGKRDASRILELTTELIDEYAIREKVYYIGVDNGANMLKAFRDLRCYEQTEEADSEDDGKNKNKRNLNSELN